jgi:hypothetical protein
MRRFMPNALDSKQVVSFEELFVSQVVPQEGLTRSLVKKGYSPRRSLGKDQPIIFYFLSLLTSNI